MRKLLVLVIGAGLLFGCSDNPTQPTDAPTIYGTWQASFTAVYMPCVDCPEGGCSVPDTVEHVSTVTLTKDGNISVAVEPPCWGSPFAHCMFDGQPFESFDGRYRIERGLLKVVRDSTMPDITEDYQFRVTADSLFPTLNPGYNDSLDIYIIGTSGILWGKAFLKSPPFARASE